MERYSMSNSKTKLIIATLLFAGVLIFSLLWQESIADKPVKAEQKTPALRAKQIILYYGSGCPHCAAVETYLKKNKTRKKIHFDNKEIYHNRSNASELKMKAKICGLSEDAIRVPFLWNGENCLIGDLDIINFFKQQEK
jgi:glutaredoxin